MLSRFGIEASQAAWYVIAFAIILVLLALMGWLMRKFGGGRLMLPGQDRGRARQPRLGVVDIYDLDRQRQLILLRRDNVEHLLLIGGPNDLVVETNIVRAAGARLPSAPGEASVERLEPSFERPGEAPARPQVEAATRPSIENQLAGRLGVALDQAPAPEKVAAAPVNAPEPAVPLRREPVLKPDQIVAGPAPVTPLRPSGNRPSEAPQPSGEAAPRQPVAPTPVSERAAPPPQRPAAPPSFRATNLPQDRAVGSPGAGSAPREAAPSAPRQPGPAVPPQGATPPASPVRGPDAAILSDMARQLEEALRKPTRPSPSEARPQPPETPRGPLDDDLVEAAPEKPSGRAGAPPPPGRVSPPPATNAPGRPAVPASALPPRGPISAPPSMPERPVPGAPRQGPASSVQGPVLPSYPQPPAPTPAAPPRPPFPAAPGSVVMPTRAPEPAKPSAEASPPARPAEERAAPRPESPAEDKPEAPVAKRVEDSGEIQGPSKPETGPLSPPPASPREEAAPAPAAAAMAPKPTTPPPSPAAPSPSPRPASDPFSVEEIEAEFARLLGRSDGPGKS